MPFISIFVDIYRSIVYVTGPARSERANPSAFWMGCMQPLEPLEVIVA